MLRACCTGRPEVLTNEELRASVWHSEGALPRTTLWRYSPGGCAPGSRGGHHPARPWSGYSLTLE